MPKETLHQYLLRRLDDLKGHHNRIAIETGVGQATVSRIYLRKVVPRLNTSQLILDWIERHDQAVAEKAGAPLPTGLKSAAAVRRAVEPQAAEAGAN